MRTFNYWAPGGETGTIKAYTFYSAATQILKTSEVYPIRDSLGACYTNPMRYTNENGLKSCKIWENI